MICRAFRSDELYGGIVENAEETHFVMNMDNGRTLRFKGEEEVKRVKVVSGGVGKTIIVRHFGRRSSRTENFFMVLKHQEKKRLFKGATEIIQGASYRTEPKELMDSTVMSAWLKERRVFCSLPIIVDRFCMWTAAMETFQLVL